MVNTPIRSQLKKKREIIQMNVLARILDLFQTLSETTETVDRMGQLDNPGSSGGKETEDPIWESAAPQG